jgi:hypothetical protein
VRAVGGAAADAQEEQSAAAAAQVHQKVYQSVDGLPINQGQDLGRVLDEL